MQSACIKTTLMIVKIRALVSGQFRRSRNINDVVGRDDVVGRIFHQGVFNKQKTPSAGVITSIAEDDEQVTTNSVICMVDNEAEVPVLAGSPVTTSLSSFKPAAKKASRKVPKKAAKKALAKKKVEKRKTASRKKTTKKKTATKKTTKAKRAKKAGPKKKTASKKTGSRKMKNQRR